MTLRFYKLQVAGNGFILVDSSQSANAWIKGLDTDGLGALSRSLCDRRYGIGATGCAFLSGEGQLRTFNGRGRATEHALDAVLCAARYAYDSGRAAGKTLTFKTPSGDSSVSVLGAHQFRVCMGAPFSLLTGEVITSESVRVAETISIEGTSLSCSAIHVREDVVTAFPKALGTLDFQSFSALAKKAFPATEVIPSIAQAITRETIIVKASPRMEAGASAVAAAALTTAVSSGLCERDAIVLFESPGSGGDPDGEITRDRDNSRRLAASWDAATGELFISGSGGYLFEGTFDAANPQEA